MQTHWFLDPIKHKYADFTGRATRQEFWMFILSYVILYVGLLIVGGIINVPQIALLFSLAVLFPGLAITARRLHDVGMSGWWQLIGLIPLLGLIVMIVLTIRPGNAAANQYDNPVSTASSNVVTPTPEVENHSAE